MKLPYSLWFWCWPILRQRCRNLLPFSESSCPSRHRCLGPQSASATSLSLVIMFCQWKAKNKLNLSKKRWSTLLPGHWDAKRVIFPSMVSSLKVLWVLQFSSLTCKSTTKCAKACLGWAGPLKFVMSPHSDAITLQRRRPYANKLDSRVGVWDRKNYPSILLWNQSCHFGRSL